MKKLLIALLLIPGFCFGQANLTDGSIFWDTSQNHTATRMPYIISSYAASSSLSYPVPNCEPWEKFTDWYAANEGVKECLHVWVNAEWGDINQLSMIQTSQYCQCGCDKQENEARICAACTRHEKRIRFYGWENVPRKSPYLELLKKIQR